MPRKESRAKPSPNQKLSPLIKPRQSSKAGGPSQFGPGPSSGPGFPGLPGPGAPSFPRPGSSPSGPGRPKGFLDFLGNFETLLKLATNLGFNGELDIKHTW